MLTTLKIKNLALVETIRMDFSRGLHVITGETGAGKSVLIGSLGLLLGERADNSLIRSGEEACGVEAVFELAAPERINHLLREHGLPECEQAHLVVRRIIRRAGANQNLVNDTPVTLAVLRSLGAELVDLHGPHDHQSLFHPQDQLELLDAFAHAAPQLERYRPLYLERCALAEELAALQSPDEDEQALTEILEYRLREIEEAALTEEEEAALRAEHETLAHAARIQELGAGLLAALAQGEPGACDLLVAARRLVEDLVRLYPPAEAWRDDIEAATRRLQELSGEIETALDPIENQPARLAWLDQRMAVYQRLKRKYGPSLAEVQTVLNEARERLEAVSGRGERAAAVRAQLEEKEVRLQEEGRALRALRHKAAQQLGRAVMGELKLLGLTRAAFRVTLAPCAPQAKGLDAVEFEFAPNPGEPGKPLRAIASSGESSRVMLALKTVLADHDRVPVLVFDEIDANLGGPTAHAVGRKLHAVAQRHQVLCITHLPQVAVCGQTHYAVEKEVCGGRTYSRVRRLDAAERAEEVARMLGGRETTSLALVHARELLAQAPS